MARDEVCVTSDEERHDGVSDLLDTRGVNVDKVEAEVSDKGGVDGVNIGVEV